MKTAVIGNNGVGKTTLLNLIDNRDQQIYIVPKAVHGYFYQGFENLDYNKTILENVMKDRAFWVVHWNLPTALLTARWAVQVLCRQDQRKFTTKVTKV